MIHLSQDDPKLNWKACKHRPLMQQFIRMTDDFAVETIHGTMCARAGDVLMRGPDGTLYCLTDSAFRHAYEEP